MSRPSHTPRRPAPATLAFLVGAGLLAMLTSGCGKGSITDRPEETTTTAVLTAEDYADALAPMIAKIDLVPIDFDQAKCLATAWVDAIGVKALRAGGVTPEGVDVNKLGITQEQAQTMVTAFPGCGLDLASLGATAIGDYAQADPTERACIAKTLTQDQVQAFFVTTLTGGKPDESLLTTLTACLGS